MSSATIVPQDGVVADITRSKDQLYLIPGNAVGTAMPDDGRTVPLSRVGVF